MGPVPLMPELIFHDNGPIWLSALCSLVLSSLCSGTGRASLLLDKTFIEIASESPFLCLPAVGRGGVLYLLFSGKT